MTSTGSVSPPDRPDRARPNWERRGPVLPDWMRDPPPPRLTIGRRIAIALARRPAWAALRRRWWAWQDRRRLYQRFPAAFKIIAFFVCWMLALALVLATYTVYTLI